VSLSWVIERMPHKPPMRLVDEVVSASDSAVVCRARIGEDHILREPNGRVSPLFAVELFAQTAAALMVYRSGQEGAGAFSGYLVGTRRIDIDIDAFDVGDEVLVTATELWGAGALAQLDCTVERGGVTVARGSINVARA
jgi:predicted hotdog family 3-hydroxylacyl-ACP dehydratase